MDDLFFRDPTITARDGVSLVVVEMDPERWIDGFRRRLLAKKIRCRVTSASDELDTIHIAPILRHGDGSETVADDTFTYAKKAGMPWDEGPYGKHRFSHAGINFEQSSCCYREDVKEDGDDNKGHNTGISDNNDKEHDRTTPSGTTNTNTGTTTEPSSLRPPPSLANAYLRPSTRRLQLITIYLDKDATDAAVAKYREAISGSKDTCTSTELLEEDNAIATAEVDSHRDVSFSCDMPVTFQWHEYPDEYRSSLFAHHSWE